ncbi:MAG TPA: glycosyltransferase family 1 protein [Candidatus Saccharimonadales bacterium]|nr:glycosyltransferase family 1 protein [Candidatus Saccharimonadales bacterium]
MHIAIDARIINSSTGTYVERLLHYLEKIDTTNTYTVLVPTKDLGYWKPTNPKFTLKALDVPNYSFAEQTTFKKVLDDLNPDLVHFCMPQQPLGYKGPHVTTVHDLTLLKTYNSDKNWFMFHAKQLVGRYLFKRIASTNRHIMVPTQYVKDDYIKFSGISPDKVTVTLEGADAAVDGLEPYEHPFKQFIMYVGQQSDYKNIKRLGDAHQKLLKKHPDLGLILVGKKNKAAQMTEAYFTKKGYRNILFTDFVPNAQRDWLFKHCDAYVFASLMEGFGLPGLEAMGYGSPVVSSNATCLPEVYGDAAHYFDPTNVDDMARAIDDVITNPELREELIRKGAEQFKKFSWERMAKQTHEVYMNALKQ